MMNAGSLAAGGMDVSTEPMRYVEMLPDDLLAACLGQLSLASLPCVSLVSERFRQTAKRSFAWQLRWRAAASSRPLPLPVPAMPASFADNSILRVGFSISSLQSGDLVVQHVDSETAAVRTICFASDTLEPYEARRRDFAEHGPFNAGVGGVVGYRRQSHVSEGMTFFPASTSCRKAPSHCAWVAEGKWQNVLQAGNVVFLLRAHANWWSDEKIVADLLDTDSGGRGVANVSPLRDALCQELRVSSDNPSRAAVSAVDRHFIFHLSTQKGAKVAGALRLPAHLDGCANTAAPAVLSFVRRWPATHAMAREQLTNEKPCGEFLMLWDDGTIYSDDPLGACVAGSQTNGRFGVHVVLLHAGSGNAETRRLTGPAVRGPKGSVTAAFEYGGIAAIDYAVASGIVAASSLPRAGLPPPAVLVWDWVSGVCLHAVLLHPLPPGPSRRRAPCGNLRPLRFPVGKRVECRMGEALWLPGVVVAHYPSNGVPGQRPLPYAIKLDRGDSCFASIDHPQTIRAVEISEETVQWNSRTQNMEVAATASLVLHPSNTRLAIGMWRDRAAAGRLYSISFHEAQS